MRLLVSAVVMLILGGFVWVVLGREDILTTPIPPWLYALVLLWGIIFMPAIGVTTMVGWSSASIGRAILRRGKPVPISEGGAWSRREWLKSAIVSLPVLSALAATAYSLGKITSFRVREMTVRIPALPPVLDGLRIAHVTDTHVGKFTRGEVLDHIVRVTNDLKADLILFTGDLIDNTIRDLPVAVKMLQRLEPASGLFVIEGNHDLFDDPDAYEKGVREGGISLLRNQVKTTTVRGVSVQILGIVWEREEEDLAAAVDTVAALRDPTAFPILLSHHPHAFDRAAELGFPLVLAGHTHGGQLMATDHFGAGPIMFRYWSGLYQKLSSALVVSNGTGNWFPLRVNAPAEIVHLTLRGA